MIHPEPAIEGADSGGEPRVFAVRRGEIIERADINFAMTTAGFKARYARPKYKLVPLADVIDLIQYGTSTPATTEPLGLPVLRMVNLQDDGWDLTDLKYAVLPDAQVKRYLVKKGGILFNRTNGSKELVGKCEMFREQGRWLFASYLIRMRTDPAKALPHFVSAFLNTVLSGWMSMSCGQAEQPVGHGLNLPLGHPGA